MFSLTSLLPCQAQHFLFQRAVDSRAIGPMADIIKDLEATQSFLATVNSPQSQQQQADVWVQRLSVLAVTPPSAVTIAETLAKGPWTNAQKDRLTEALNSALLTRPEKGRRGMQSCNNFKAYLTKSDLESLQSNEVSYLSKIDLVTTRMIRIGLQCPSEKCFGIIVATVDSLANVKSTDDELKVKLEDYKRSLRNKKKTTPKAEVHLLEYPTDPRELPRELCASGWDESDPPARLNVGPGDMITPGPLRNHNRRLTMNKNMAMAQGVPQGGVSGMLMNMMLQQQQMFMQMAGRGQDAELPGFQVFKPNRGGQKRQLALEDQPAAEPETSQPAAASQAAPATVQQVVQQVPTPQQALHVPAVTQEPANDLPEVSAEDQANAVSEAMKSRKDYNAAPKAASKAKAKATAKSVVRPKAAPKATAKATAKSMVRPKASPKPRAKGKAKAAPRPRNHLQTFVVNGKDLTPAFRLKLFPTGCSKCRHRSGCTRSCWVGRKF